MPEAVLNLIQHLGTPGLLAFACWWLARIDGRLCALGRRMTEHDARLQWLEHREAK